MVEVGDTAPSFTLPGIRAGEETAISLDALGEVVVCAFYPFDFDPTWTEALRDLDLLGLRTDVEVLGISADTVPAHGEFATQEGIDATLASDRTGEVADAFDVAWNHRGHQSVPRPAVFVLDDRRRVVFAWVGDDAESPPPIDDVRAAVRDVGDDETARQRYRSAFDTLQYGRSEFNLAEEADEEADWPVAGEAYREAAYYFEAAAEEFETAGRYADTPELTDAAEEAAAVTGYLEQAARWYARAAQHDADGSDAAAADCRADAERRAEQAEDQGEVAEPEELASRLAA